LFSSRLRAVRRWRRSAAKAGIAEAMDFAHDQLATGRNISRRLEAIPGVGPPISTAVVASISDPKAFRSGRDLGAWIGLAPKQNSTGGKERLGGIGEAGNITSDSCSSWGALAVVRRAKQFD
jgi:transposase